MIKRCQWRIQGGFQGFHGTPFSAQLSSKSVCTVSSFSLDRTPYLINSKIILTIAHLQVFLNEFWSITCSRAQQTANFDREWAWSTEKWAWLQKFARVLSTRTPLSKILDPPLGVASKATLQHHIITAPRKLDRKGGGRPRPHRHLRDTNSQSVVDCPPEVHNPSHN